MDGAPAVVPACLRRSSTMKTILSVIAAALLCAACAGGPAAGAGSGSIDMYGVIDEGVTFHR
jgi:ABC-type glycerol-3-phosphate transport system substrate-binding protein